MKCLAPGSGFELQFTAISQNRCISQANDMDSNQRLALAGVAVCAS